MKRTPTMFRHTLVALGLALALASHMPAHAAHWSLLAPGTPFDLLDQAGTVNGLGTGQSTLGSLQDLSAPGQQALFDSQASGGQPLGNATLEQGYTHFVSVDTQGGSATAELMLSAAQYWNVAATGDTSVSGFYLTQDLALGDVRLRIVGDAGEAEGTRVRVSFSGVANALFGGLPGQGETGLSLDISRGTQRLASHDSLWSADGARPIDLSFEAVVGDELVLTLSAHQQLTQGFPVLLGAGQRLDIDRSGLLQGQLTVTAVPEPQGLAMALGGLAVLGCVLRRSSCATSGRGTDRGC